MTDGSVDRRRFLGALAVGAGTLALAGASGPVLEVGHPYRDVAAMLAADPFYIAHHGCSLTWPEMSRYAYTRAARAGLGALELSLARTRDGVWFGLHDANLDRTSGISGKTASELTWAQVQRFQILGSTAAGNPTQPNRPYLRWEELIAAYYPSHVIFVDPKHALEHRAELMTKMDALPGTPQDHLVCKYYGVSGDRENRSGWARRAALRGYRSWGYFYETDARDLADYQGRWDILGLDYSADESTWAAMLSYGKPVIAHVVPDRAAATTALHKGAAGLMVSSPAALKRPSEPQFRPALASLPSRR